VQHSPQRVGVSSVGIRQLPAASSPGKRSSGRVQESSAPSNAALSQLSPGTKVQTKASKLTPQRTVAVRGAEGAEAAAWLSVARDDPHTLASALPHLSINVTDEDGETLLLCACRFGAICCAARPRRDGNASLARQMLQRRLRTAAH
jgi:hypothetical protein